MRSRDLPPKLSCSAPPRVQELPVGQNSTAPKNSHTFKITSDKRKISDLNSTIFFFRRNRVNAAAKPDEWNKSINHNNQSITQKSIITGM